MKFNFILTFLLLISFKGFSQLTVNETINYIDKKLKECEDLQRTYNDQLTYVVTGLGLGIDANNKDKVILSYNRKFSDGSADELQYIFDPTHISVLTDKQDSYKDALGMVGMSFISKTIITKQRISGKVTDIIGTGFTFPYLKTDPLNFERMKKAFLHLKELYVQRKGLDPFAN